MSARFLLFQRISSILVALIKKEKRLEAIRLFMALISFLRKNCLRSSPLPNLPLKFSIFRPMSKICQCTTTVAPETVLGVRPRGYELTRISFFGWFLLINQKGGCTLWGRRWFSCTGNFCSWAWKSSRKICWYWGKEKVVCKHDNNLMSFR